MDLQENQDKPSVYHRAVKGGAWVAATRISQGILGFVRIIILGRLLDPRDFGIMGIASLCLSVMEVFTNMGLFKALVQQKESLKRQLDVAWTAGLLRGLFLFGTLFLLAPWVGVFFDNKGWFEPQHLRDPVRFIQTLETKDDPLTQCLWQKLSPSVRKEIQSVADMPSASDKLREILSKDLNRLLETESFAQQECFKFLLDSSGHDAAGKADSRRVRINRKLLERAFPDLIQPVVLDRPRLIAIIRVIALIFLLRSLMNIGTVHLTKDLNFDRLFILETVGAVVEMSVSIGLVLVLGSVWALVVGRLVSSFLVCLCSYIVHPYRPKLSFDFGLIKNLFGYGKHVFSGTVLNFLVLEGDDIFVGKFFGASLLGLYRYAYKISNIAATEIGNLLGEVAFPAYSKLQDNMPKLLAGFRRTVQLMTLLAYPVSGGLMVLAGEFTSVFLGPKWMGMVPAMQIMCVLGAAKCLHIGVVFMSIGRPDMQVKFTLLRLVVMIVTIYPLAKFYGLTGVAFSVTFSAMVPLPWQLWSMKKIIKFPIGQYLSLLSLPFFATLIMMAVLMAIKQFLPVGFLSLVAQVALGASIYIGSVFALSRLYDNYNPLDIMMQFKKVLLDGKKA